MREGKMATVPKPVVAEEWTYPTSDGKPVAETDLHYLVMRVVRQILDAFFASDPMVYVSGNNLMYYERGNRRRHISPDVYVVKGVRKRLRPNYLVWSEGKGPDVVIELTSSSTRHEDTSRRYRLYQDVLKVPEYFLFDPLGDYLDPPLQGYRRRASVYQPIRAVRGRFPSRVLGLHLERVGDQLRLYDPATGAWLPTPDERIQHEVYAREEAEAEVRRLRQELDELQRRSNG
jgi:Uma2 family endonuclease